MQSRRRELDKPGNRNKLRPPGGLCSLHLSARLQLDALLKDHLFHTVVGGLPRPGGSPELPTAVEPAVALASVPSWLTLTSATRSCAGLLVTSATVMRNIAR